MELLLECSDSRFPCEGRVSVVSLAHDTYCNEFSHPLLQGQVGASGTWQGRGSEGRGARKAGPVAPLPPPCPSGANLQLQFMLVLRLPPGLQGSASGPGPAGSQRMPCRASGWGGCDHSGTQTPDIPFWGCRREAKRNVKRCLKAWRKPAGLSRSSICGKKPWHGAAGSTAKIDRGAEKRLNSGSNVPPQRKSRSREWGRPRPSLQLPSGPQHQTERGRES